MWACVFGCECACLPILFVVCDTFQRGNREEGKKKSV